MSRKTLVLGSVMTLLSAEFGVNRCFAGTIGTAESEQNRLQDEVTAARNALDALVLQPGMKLDDPRVKEKSAALDEKMNAFRKGFQEALTPTPGPTSYPNKTPDRDNGERDEKDTRDAGSQNFGANPAPTTPVLSRVESPREPETVLSGEGVSAEIQYSKKSKSGKTQKPIPRLSPKFGHAEEPVPTGTTAPDAAGLSEIEYPKKKGLSPK